MNALENAPDGTLHFNTKAASVRAGWRMKINGTWQIPPTGLLTILVSHVEQAKVGDSTAPLFHAAKTWMEENGYGDLLESDTNAPEDGAYG